MRLFTFILSSLPCLLPTFVQAEEVIAKATEVRGKIFISSVANGAFIPLEAGYPLISGQKIAPLAGTKATILMGDLLLEVPAQTEVVLGDHVAATATTPDGYGIRLMRGLLRAHLVDGATRRDNLAVHTPVGLAHFSPDPSGENTLLVEVRPEGTTAVHAQGCCTVFSTTKGEISLKGDNLLSIATSSLEAPSTPTAAPKEWLADAEKSLK